MVSNVLVGSHYWNPSERSLRRYADVRVVIMTGSDKGKLLSFFSLLLLKLLRLILNTFLININPYSDV